MPEDPIPADPSAVPASPPAASPVPADLSPAACASRLAELFPAVFGPGAPQPLKLRVQADVQQRAPGIFTRRALSQFLHRHTTGTAYLKALLSAPHRVDLDGQPAGEVVDEHRQAAAVELERRRALHDARRAAEREAQRAAHDAARRAHAAQDRERSERAALLRAYEATTLTQKNFCALKGVPETELDAMLAQARLEREQRALAAPQPDRHDRPSPLDRPQRPDARRDDHRQRPARAEAQHRQGGTPPAKAAR